MLQLEGFKFSGGPDEKKDEVTHIGMFRRQLAKSFGHLRSRSNTGPTMDASAAGERSQNDLSRDSSTSAGIYRDASAQNLAEGPVTDSNLATGPNPGATAAKLKVGAAHLTQAQKAVNRLPEHCCCQMHTAVGGSGSVLVMPMTQEICTCANA